MNRDILFVRGLLVFWSLWITLVATTNALDALVQLGVLSEGSWASGNYAYMVEVTSELPFPRARVGVLFAGVVAWEAIAMCLCWRAALRPDLPDRSYAAFGALLGLMAVFILADEVFIAYGLEHTHTGIFTALLASFAVTRWMTPP